MNRLKAPLLLIVAALSACSVSGSHTGPSGTSQVPDASRPTLRNPLDVQGGGPATMMQISLGDAAPQIGGTLKHLYVGVDRVDVTSNGNTRTVASFNSPQIVDLLRYQGDSGAQLGNAANTSQTYSSITFVLDIATSQAVFSDGATLPITYLVNAAPSSTSGIDGTMATVADGPGAVDVTSNQTFTVAANNAQSVRADFNALESFGVRNGALFANPVIVVAPRPLTRIQGKVVGHNGNAVEGATVVAYRDGIARNTGYTNADGSFHIGTLSSGTYQLVIYNTYRNAAGAVFQAKGQATPQSSVAGPTLTVQQGSDANVGTLAD